MTARSVDAITTRLRVLAAAVEAHRHRVVKLDAALPDPRPWEASPDQRDELLDATLTLERLEYEHRMTAADVEHVARLGSG